MLYVGIGSILIDGVRLDSLPLAVARGAVVMIPQDPKLFRGSLRSNLDPLGRCSDEQLWTVLERSK